MTDNKKPIVGIWMGSANDWNIMQQSAKILEEFGVAYEVKVISAHRTPDLFFQEAQTLEDRGFKIMIGGAGAAAHLPGVLAAKTTIPVLGVPINATALAGVDSLYAIVQMPQGIPVATFAIGKAGAANAALFAVAMLATTNDVLSEKLKAFRAKQAEKIKNTPPPQLS